MKNKYILYLLMLLIFIYIILSLGLIFDLLPSLQDYLRTEFNVTFYDQ